jgi:hypothetical protein
MAASALVVEGDILRRLAPPQLDRARSNLRRSRMRQKMRRCRHCADDPMQRTPCSGQRAAGNVQIPCSSGRRARRKAMQRYPLQRHRMQCCHVSRAKVSAASRRALACAASRFRSACVTRYRRGIDALLTGSSRLLPAWPRAAAPSLRRVRSSRCGRCPPSPVVTCCAMLHTHSHARTLRRTHVRTNRHTHTNTHITHAHTQTARRTSSAPTDAAFGTSASADRTPSFRTMSCTESRKMSAATSAALKRIHASIMRVCARVRVCLCADSCVCARVRECSGERMCGCSQTCARVCLFCHCVCVRT